MSSQQLFPQSELDKLRPILSTAELNEEQIICPVKVFDPCSAWTWYLIEYDPEDRIFFALVKGHTTELGCVSRDDLEAVRNRFGLPLERDLYWTPATVAEILEKRAS